MKKFLLVATLTFTGISPAFSGGIASWYGPGFHGKMTANGEIFNQHALTAAHRKYRMGSTVRVTNTANGKSVDVCINDRGPYHGNRVIDLSKEAARRIGMLGSGTARVKLQVLHKPSSYRYGRKVC